MEGKHAVRALHYSGGKLVAKSKVTYFDVQMPSMADHRQRPHVA